jgi:hypothetical protein
VHANSNTTSSNRKVRYSIDDIDQWAVDLRRIRAVARRRRLLGRPDLPLEAGCAILERRLAQMRREAER